MALQYLSCVVKDNATIASGRTKKVNFHRRKLDMVDAVDAPLEGACRHTEINRLSKYTFESSKFVGLVK